MLKRYFITLCMACAGFVAAAQTVNVTGTIKDTEGEPIPGAVVMVKGTSDGAVANIDGKFFIAVNPGMKPVLVISSVGFRTQEIKPGDGTQVDVTLEEDRELLDEAVVVGYGAMRRSDLTGAVTSVRIDDDDASRTSTLDQMIEGRSAGVQVLSDSGSPDAGISMRIRGISSFSGSTEPLYVVDGIIINGSSESISMTSIGTDKSTQDEVTNGLAGINPRDIASIEILKDASATAIYGSQGANGVVLITTKSSNKERPTVEFSAGVTVSQVMKKADILSFDEYVDMLDSRGESLSNIYSDPENRTGLLVTPIDWQDYIFRTAISQRYYMSIAGRPKGYNYMFSLGYNDNQGTLRRSDSSNLTARLNLRKDLSNKVFLSFKTNVGYTDSDIVSGAQTTSGNVQRASVLRSSLRSRPYYSQNISEDDYDEAYDPNDETAYGPMRYYNGVTNTSKRLRITPSLTFDWNILKWLSFRSTFGADYTTNRRVKTKAAVLSYGEGNIAGIGTSQTLRYNWDNLLMFKKKWSRHFLSGTLGMSASKDCRTVQSISASMLSQTNARENAINEALSSNSKIESFTETENSLLSYFGRAVYNYDERYILTTTLRFDGSSKFKGANKWGIFPSFAFAWRLLNEPWFNVPFISNAKIRAGWGQVGNQRIGSFQTDLSYSTSTIGNHFNDSGLERILYANNIPNPDLKWETSDQVNVGLDMSFWKGRLAITADAYIKRTRDLLQEKTVARSTGLSTMAINAGSILNKGLELTIDAIPLKTKQWEIMVGGNISFNRNQFLSIGADASSGEVFMSADAASPVKKTFVWGNALATGSSDTNPLNIFIEGQPMGLFYGYVTDGIVQEGEVGANTDGMTSGPGSIKYVDKNKNGVRDAGDRAVIGNPQPQFTYGFNASVSWKKLTLKVYFTGAYDFDIFNMNHMQDYDTKTTKNMYRSAYFNAWTPENKNNQWPAFGKSDNNIFSDRFVEDASYLRISNLALSYSLPINKKKAKILKGVNLSASVSNLVIFTDYTGMSPLSNSMGTNIKKMGVDINTAPLPRSYNFDVKFTF